MSRKTSREHLFPCEDILAEEETAAEALVAEIAALDIPPSSHTFLLRFYPAFPPTLGMARRLTKKAHQLMHAEPNKALALARLATSVASVASIDDGCAEAKHCIEGEAWTRYAAVLLRLSRFNDARAAVQEADMHLVLAAPYGLRTAATLGVIHGRVLYATNEPERGLRMIQESADIILNVFEEPDKYVEAMTIYGALLMSSDRYEEAAETWQEIAGLAREKGDTATLAYIVNNVGLCYLNLRKLHRAKRCFDTALRLFAKLKLAAEVPRARGGLALVLVQEGKYQDAIRLMKQNQEAFLEIGMAYDAARVALRMAETLFAAGQYDAVLEICTDAVRFFRDTGFPREASKAAAYLLEAASHRRVFDVDSFSADVAHVEMFLTQLQEAEDTVFAPRRTSNEE